MTFAEVLPDLSLADYIEAFWTLTSDGEQPPERAGTILPDGAVEIVLSWNANVGTALPGSRVHGFVVGQLDAAATIAYEGPVDLTGVRVRAAAGASLLGRSPAEFAGRIVALEDGAPSLASLLAHAIDPDVASSERLTAIERALAARLAAAPALDAAIVAATRAIVARRGRIRIGALARSLDLSARQLERRFVTAVGISPKRWARVARFRAAAESLGRPDRPALAELAHDHGYADQAHFSREFAALSGVPPARAWWT